MKKTIFISVGIALLAFTGCEDYLERIPLDQPGSATFLQTETEVIMGVNACYNMLDQGPGWVSQSHIRCLSALEDAQQKRMGLQLAAFRNGTLSPSDGEVHNFYRDYYEGVSRCHIVIDGMEAARDGMESAGKEDLWLRLQAEARVIRAWCYWNLVSKFGDLVFTTNLQEMEQYAQLKRSPEDDVYTFIFDEIDASIPNLPDSYSGTDFGRITNSAARAIGARAALYRAFFHNGAALSQPEASYLTKVRDYTQAIITDGQHELWYDPDDPKQSYRNLFTYKGENSSEMILQKEFNYAQGRSNGWLRALGSRNLPSSFASETPQEYLIASYEDTLGNTVDNCPYYDPKNPFFGRDPRLYQSVIIPRVEGPNKISVILDTKVGADTLIGFEEVRKGDLIPDANIASLQREHKSLLQSWGEEEGVNYDAWHWYKGPDGKDIKLNNQDCTNPWSSRTGYLTWKYFDMTDYYNKTESTYSVNHMFIRYADVLLMNAEALIELNENLLQARDNINMVRARGYGMQLNEYMSHPSYKATTDPSELRDLVRRERKVELFGEGLRYEDLKRYGRTVEALGYDVVGRPKFWHREAATNIPQIDGDGVVRLPWLEGLDGQAADYPNRWWMKSNYQPYYDLWPIPQEEIDNSEALTEEDQNPGYSGG